MLPSHQVCILQSIPNPAHFYAGVTADLSARLTEHNEGGTPHTAAHRPWSIKTVIAFTDPERASAFERNLKSGSGRAFAKNHFE